jgi:hypothetical protein
MSRPKSLLKNAQRIAECKTPDLMQEPGQDILQKLRDYRASSVLKYSSPVKVASKGLTKLNEKVPSSRSYRPASSPYGEPSVVTRSGERPGHRSKKLSQDLYYQEKSVERLYKGSRILSGNLFNLNEGSSEKLDMANQTSTNEIQDFLQSIRILYPLRFDLELNYEVIKGKNIQSQHNMMGDFYSLKEKIDDLLRTSPDELKDLSSGEFLKILQEYNRVIRHVLLGLKVNENDDEASILEMLWRIIVKLIDNALIMHEQIVIDLTKKMKEKVKEIDIDAKEKVRKLQNELNFQREEADKKIEKMSETIKLLSSNLSNKEQMIHERDERMNELLEGTNRDKSCIEMTRILKKLDAYISETEDQQHKQVAALSGISHVMSLAENFDGKPESSLTLVQTDVTLPDNRFPELKVPILSKNLFYSLGEPDNLVSRDLVMQYLMATLEDCNGDEVFLVQFGRFLVDRLPSKSEILNFMKKTGQVLLHPTCQKSKFFSRLFGFPHKLFKNFELVLLKISSCLGSIEGKTSNNHIPLFKAIETLQSILPNHQLQVQSILSRLTYTCEVPSDIKKNTWVLVSRFYFAFEKTKKPLKFHLDSLDSKREGFSNHYSVPSSTFVDWVKSKLNIWMKDSEITTLVNYFGGEILKTSAVLEKFSAAHIEKCKEIQVDKEEILAFLIQDWEEYQRKQIKLCQIFQNCSTFSE